MKTTVRVDGVMVATFAALGVGLYMVTRPGGTFNPASSNNAIYKAVGGGTGGAFDKGANKVFAAIDLINPFNDSDAYAREVWGLNK